MQRLPIGLSLILLAAPCAASADAVAPFATTGERAQKSASDTPRPPRPVTPPGRGRPDAAPGREGRTQPSPPSQRGGNPRPLGLGGNPPPGHGGPPPDRASERPTPPSGHPLQVCGPDGPTAVGPDGARGRSLHAMLRLGQPANNESGDALPWAGLAYRWVGASLQFVLTAHQLAPEQAWTLAILAGDGSAICLASGLSNRGGQLRLRDNVNPDSHLPAALDPFALNGDGNDDATVVLLPAADVECDSGVFAGADAALVAASGLRFIHTEHLTCP